MLVAKTAIRLVLAACVGGTFKNVRAGTIIIPPPTPSIEPRVPAPSPTTSKNVSVAILSSKPKVFLSDLKKSWRGKNRLEGSPEHVIDNSVLLRTNSLPWIERTI
jgi:hypothetical protein